jgi:RNA polymerase sigma-70 factor (ECF subfamily)
VTAPTIETAELETRFQDHRTELQAYCYRMLASPFEAQDAVQETFIRAWKAVDRFEGRSSLRSWLYRIATNVCLDMLRSGQRRARPMDLGPAQEPVASNLRELPETTWLEPAPDGLLMSAAGDPAETAAMRDSVRLAFVAALQHLPARQRAALILCEVLQWKASEAAELLETSVASVNSALQRARATLGAATPAPDRSSLDAQTLSADDSALLTRYMQAFEAYDMSALTELIHEDATQSMPPFDLWLSGRDDVFAWWFGPGIGCAGSKLVPVGTANGSPAYGQYKPDPDGGYSAWAIQVVEVRRDEVQGTKVGEMTFFLDTEALFPLFGLPLRLES